jgi:hypothetical protein
MTKTEMNRRAALVRELPPSELAFAFNQRWFRYNPREE